MLTNEALTVSFSLTLARAILVEEITGTCIKQGWSYPTDAEFAAMSVEELKKAADNLKGRVEEIQEEEAIHAREQQDLWNLENEEFGNDPDEGYDPYSNSYTDDC